MNKESSPESLLDAVTDRETFLAFVWSLVEDRQKADAIEAADPELHRWGGAEGWQNQTIVSLLEATVAGSAHPSWPEQGAEAPSWKDFALFLLMGKIYE